MLEIKPGLLYNSATVLSSKHNTVEVIQKKNNISLTYIFAKNDNENSSENILALEHTFIFSREYILAYDKDLELDIFFYSGSQPLDICCNTHLILHEITTSKWKGAFKKIFLESKALTLLLCFRKTSSTSPVPDCVSCKFLNKPVEKVKIMKAREIILSRLSSPPTIQELSLEIGMNQCYLKKGFKEVFSLTIYDFIQEERMNKAKMLLLYSNISVSEIANLIGFSSISNFSNAFKKFSGVFPRELQSLYP